MWNIKKVWVDFWCKVLKFSYKYSENRPIVHRLRGSPCTCDVPYVSFHIIEVHHVEHQKSLGRLLVEGFKVFL